MFKLLLPVTVPECDKGDVRLVCGINNRTGQVEICHKNLWNSVSHYNWGLEEAMVACRHLGLPNDGRKQYNTLAVYLTISFVLQQKYT